ncbi:lipoprotein BA_5634 family protein [Bacillus gaemokensis]|uniref:Lipoprotein n=1 Tax=Bacillus gaemokensis TaxID=574375 RepID=A0A073K898_9BACI|nr:lipoprotein BA_5634 family protein [Bacillus gaemokensis]KEK22795.1 hypothetical protein BAGA_16205 [Bacillus gaemokensis]KYG36790.1 hypothetical protein AZF08_24410 [Bacillus gaemokensis]
MKQLLIMLIITLLIFISLQGCSKSNQGTQPVNGIVIVGEEQYALPILERYQENVKTKDVFRVKTGMVDEKKVLILDESTANKLIAKKLIHKRKDVNGNMDSIPLVQLPEIPKGRSLLFTTEHESDITSINLNETEIPVTYDRNAWIGNVGDYEPGLHFIVSKNEVYQEIQVEETSLQFLYLKKSLGDKKPTMSTDNTVVNEYLKMKKRVKNFNDLIVVKFVTIDK